MATYEELSVFTYGELEDMRLTHNDLFVMSQEELLAIAKEKLERFRDSGPETVFSPEIEAKLPRIVEVYGTYIENLNVTVIQQSKPRSKKFFVDLFVALLSAGAGALVTWLLSKIGF